MTPRFTPIAAPPARPATWIVATVVVVSIASLAYLAGSRTTSGAALATAKASPARTAGGPPSQPSHQALRKPHQSRRPDTRPGGNDGQRVGRRGAPCRPSDRAPGGQRGLASNRSRHALLHRVVQRRRQRAQEVSSFLENNALDPLELRVYRSKLSGRDRYGVIYGDYAWPRRSRYAVAGRQNQPGRQAYIRSVSKLR